jgi:exonuclease SbcD
MSLVFIHAADFHLGADLRRFGDAREKLEQAQFAALEKTLNEAVANRAAFVIICGDLFDRRNPRPSVIRKTTDIFSANPRIPVYILPGTHDFLSDNSIYSPGRPGWTGENITILNDSVSSPLQLPGTGCTLYFQPNRSNRSAQSPIAGMKRQSDDGFHIGLAHGSLKIMGLEADLDFPLDPKEIEKTQLDYLALGHWHKPRMEKYGRTMSVYPGIPQPISWSDPGSGSVSLVRLEDTGEVTIAARPINLISFHEIRSKIFHPMELNQLLEKAADPNTIVKLSLDYSDNLKEVLEIEKIIEEASSRFLAVHTNQKNDGNSSAPLNIPDKTHDQLIEAFKAELARMKDADSSERAELYNKAAELGVAIITGEE